MNNPDIYQQHTASQQSFSKLSIYSLIILSYCGVEWPFIIIYKWIVLFT